uniref:RE44287p n=1 Tax=Drosophila melanogaster TaxID=7227 RepID=Q7JUW8_DROME|nr:uncharacterized protein Dmel_CG13196 [Drosophila melanogaster]AAF58629.1 uncharacterized protein Dmel_CG13196 [Drosophila melanogaster]AAM50298.1 RE44287p [Drosophila melanogaster]|eukprot:NP_610695.1 uncharacterized protein Dmel_CG13196 [Drosophila melanogaster]
MSTKRIIALFGLLTIHQTHADVSHFFASPLEHYGNYLHGQVPFQVGLSPSNLYGPPPAAPITPAPVAPVATTEFSLPEIIENRSVKIQGSGHGNFIPLSQHYLPPAVDERPNYESPKPSEESYPAYYYPQPGGSIITTSTPTTTTTSRPIIVQDPGDDVETIHSPGYDYHAPVAVPVFPQKPSTPAPVYLPPSDGNQDQNQLRLRLKDMRCLSAGYFRAVLKLDSFLGAAPTVDQDNDDQQDKRCELRLSRSFLLLDISGENFERCGVRSCGQDLCLRLRFPAIRGLRTSGDSILTLHCKAQERVAVKTHALKMGVANDVQARSGGSYAHGGDQNAFRTHVELLRKGSTGYTRHLENNGAVQLGEELLLRAHVLAGDGWNYTKLSDVQLQRIATGGEILNTVQLVSSRGCLNPAMQAICAHPPILEPPLGQRLHFKAVMFPGMRSGEVLVISMRITGCLEREDCQVTAQDCLPSVGQRRRRNVSHGNSTEVSELSHLTFRVLMPGEEDVSPKDRDIEIGDSGIRETSKSLALFGSLGFVVMLMGVAVVALYKFGK